MSNFLDQTGLTTVWNKINSLFLRKKEPSITISSGATYKPYFESGDTIYFDDLRTSGYVTNAKEDIWFTAPLAKPVVGVACGAVSLAWNDGMMVRDVSGKYSHGSTYTTTANRIKPSSVLCQLTGKDSDNTYSAVRIRCQPTSTANATNNVPCGIEASFTLTFG